MTLLYTQFKILYNKRLILEKEILRKERKLKSCNQIVRKQLKLTENKYHSKNFKKKKNDEIKMKKISNANSHISTKLKQNIRMINKS